MTVGNTAYNDEDRVTSWEKPFKELKDFVSDAKLGGFSALRWRNKDLNNDKKIG